MTDPPDRAVSIGRCRGRPAPRIRSRRLRRMVKRARRALAARRAFAVPGPVPLNRLRRQDSSRSRGGRSQIAQRPG